MFLSGGAQRCARAKRLDTPQGMLYSKGGKKKKGMAGFWQTIRKPNDYGQLYGCP